MAHLRISPPNSDFAPPPSATTSKSGLLPPAQRISGQRRYDASALHRLAIILRARQLGFTLDDIRQLFFGFGNATRASARWRKLSQRKLNELDTLMKGIKEMRRLLKRIMHNCRCETLDHCGKAIFRKHTRGCSTKKLCCPPADPPQRASTADRARLPPRSFERASTAGLSSLFESNSIAIIRNAAPPADQRAPHARQEASKQKFQPPLLPKPQPRKSTDRSPKLPKSGC